MIRIRETLALALGVGVALPALSTMAAEPTAAATAKLDGKLEITLEEAQEDDILLVIDLPIIVADARDAGVEEEELTQVITVAADSGLSASATAEILTAETEVTKDKGKRQGLGTFVKLQLAEGVKGKELAAKIRERKDERKDMTPEERAALEARILELRERNKQHKLALAEKRKELRGQGKVIKLLAQDLHDARKTELVARKSELEKARKEHAHARKEHHEARDEAHEANAERKEEREDLKDAREDLKAADTREEKKAAVEDLKDAREDLKDAKKDARDAKKDVKDAKDDKAKAAKEHGKAAHDAKAHKGDKDKKGG
jgi:chromosome segregation ATPase